MEFTDESIVNVQNQSHALENPMRRMFGCLEIRNKHLTHTHCVFTVLGNVHWGFEIVFDFEFACFGRDNLNDRHLGNQFFGS